MKSGLSIVVLVAALAWSHGQATDHPRVFVVGAVNRPGSFCYEQRLTIENVIERAGGVRHPCMTNRLMVVRMQDGRKVRLAASTGTVLQAGDTVDVMEVNDGESRCK
jgi:protein involved in polysaccharide export with SLBB domain